MRLRTALTLAGVALCLPACLAGRLGEERTNRLAQIGEPEAGPEITIFLTAYGGDSITVYLDGSDSDRRAIAERLAVLLGFPGKIAHEDDFYPDTDNIPLDTRVMTPGAADGEWVFDFDATGLLRVLRESGYDEATLILCTPPVETRLRVSRPPDLEGLETGCDLNGTGWTFFTTDEPLRVRATFVAEPADYLAYAAGVLLGTVLLGALSWFIADRLRAGPFRRRSAAGVAIGLIGGGFAAFGFGVLTAGIGGAAGPADNLALARDLAVGGYASSVLFPSLIATAPGIIFLIKMVRRGADDADEHPITAMPIPPPGPPGAPPLPWS